MLKSKSDSNGSQFRKLPNEFAFADHSGDGRVDKALQRIARTALRRKDRIADSSNRVAALARDVVRRLPDTSAMTENELVSYVARRLQAVIRQGNFRDGAVGTSARGDTAIRPVRQTVLAN